MIIFNDNAFVIEKFVFEEYKEQISKSKAEISNVVKMFKDFARYTNIRVKMMKLNSFVS